MTTTDDARPSHLDRRTLLKGGATLAAGVALGGLFQALAARAAAASGSGSGKAHKFSPDYGPLHPARDDTTGLELLLLPKGFE